MRALLLMSLAVGFLFAADEPPGAVLYKKYCATCHESGADRMPTKAVLMEMRSATILKALATGLMREQGSKLSSQERQIIAAWLGKTAVHSISGSQLQNRCSSPAGAHSERATWSGWGGAANTRFESQGLQASDLSKLKLKWAFGMPDATSVRSQPTVYGGRVFFGSQDGTVYSLDAATGCLHWATSTVSSTRSGVTVGPVGSRMQVFLGDATGRYYSLDANTGALIWQLQPDAHPAAMATATPALHNGVVYLPVSSFEEASATTPGYVCCTFRGSVSAVDAATGKVIWKTYTIDEPAVVRASTKRGAKTMGPSGVGIWTAPTLDVEKNLIYVTTGDNYSDPPTKTSDAVLALHMQTGKIAWSKQLTANDAYNSSCVLADKVNCPDSDGPDHDFGSSAILVKTASRRLLLLPQKSGMMHAIDPDKQGEIVWQSRAAKGGVLGGLQWGSASDGSRVYAPISDIGFTRIRIPGSNDLRRTVKPDQGGGIVAFQVDNGERIWFAPPALCGDRSPCSPAQSSAATAIRGAVLSGSVDGHMRAYSTRDGKVLWDFDTVRDFQTINGVSGRGGSIDAGGAVVAGDMLFVGSGYAQWSALPGNVLLAFQVER